MSDWLCDDCRFVLVAGFVGLADLLGARFTLLFDSIGIAIGARFAFVMCLEGDFFG